MNPYTLCKFFCKLEVCMQGRPCFVSIREIIWAALLFPLNFRYSEKAIKNMKNLPTFLNLLNVRKSQNHFSLLSFFQICVAFSEYLNFTKQLYQSDLRIGTFSATLRHKPTFMLQSYLISQYFLVASFAALFSIISRKTAGSAGGWHIRTV